MASFCPCHAAPTCSFGRNPPTSRRVGGMSPTCWRHNLLREIPFLFWFWHPTYRSLLQFPILPWHLRHQRGVPSWLQVHWNPLTLSFEVASFVCCCLLSSNDKVHRGLLDERRPITPWFSSLSTINTTLTLPRPPSTSPHNLCCLFSFSDESSIHSNSLLSCLLPSVGVVDARDPADGAKVVYRNWWLF